VISSENKKQVLGRGLGALIPAARGTAAAQPESGIDIQAQAQSRFTEAVRDFEIAAIEPNPFQTRIEID
jgi:hypothetical protein